jgi:hypothetical protein
MARSATCRVCTIDSVVPGGESGRAAQQMHPHQALSLRDQRLAALGDLDPIDTCQTTSLDRVAQKVAGPRARRPDLGLIPIGADQ